MNKKTNTVLFILGATVYNILVLVILLGLGLLLLGLAARNWEIGSAGSILLLLVFAGSIAGSLFIYHRTIRLLSRKIDFEKYFDPIIKPKSRR